MALQLLVKRLNAFKIRFLAALEFPSSFDGPNPPMALLDTQMDLPDVPQKSILPSISVLKDIIGNGVMWAVPRNRRTIERRLIRKLDKSKWTKPKRNLMMCVICGHYHEMHTICGNCYSKVRAETNLMRDTIQKELKFDAVDKEVVVLYDNDERHDVNDKEYWNGKRIVEMNKERPNWFHQNLKSRPIGPDTSTETSLQLNTKSIISHVK